MKKVLAIMLVCFMLVSMLPAGAFAAESKCPGKGEKHYLDNCDNEKIDHVDGKCDEYSYDVYQCKHCDDIFAANFVKNENPHVWEETEAEIPHTIDEEGKTAVETCSVCGATRGGEAIGHKYSKTERGSCGEGWFIVFTCECGHSYEEQVDGDGHKWVEIPVIDTPPTLTENGLALFACTVCGETKEVPILPHACFENLTYYEYVAAKCGVAGSHAYYECTECGDLFWDADAQNPVEDADDLIIPAEEHDTLGLVPVLVAQELQGYAYTRLNWVCPADGEYTFSTNSTNYVYMYNAGAYMGPGSFVAGKDLTVELKAGDSYDFLGYNTYTVSFAALDYVEGPVVTTGDCAKEIANILTYCCGKCGTVYDVEGDLPHNWVVSQEYVAPTCTEYGYVSYVCNLCGDYYTETFAPNGHSMTLVDELAPTCLENGYEKYECEVCGYEETKILEAPGAHDFTEVYTSATCCTYAYTETICNRCGYLLQTVVHEDQGFTDVHEDIEFLYTVNEPTCDKSGNELWFCNNCNAYLLRPVDALNHTYPADYADQDLAGESAIATIIYEPTCLEVGYTYTYCALCDYEKFDDIKEPIFDYEEEMLKNNGYKLEEALAIHKHLDLENSKPYRDGDCYIVGLEARWCFDCNTYILIEIPGTGDHLWPTDLVSKDEVQAPEIGEITGGDGFYGSGNPLIISNVPFIVEQMPWDDLTYAYTASEDITFSVTVDGDGYAMYGFSLHGMFNYMAEAGEITLLAGETLFFNIWSFNGTITLGEITMPEFRGQEPNCTDDGWTAQRYCDRCGLFEASETLPAYGHEWEYSAGWEATCTEPGCSDLKECKECGAIEGGDYIAPLGHDWNKKVVDFEDSYEIIYDLNGMPIGIECTQQFGFEYWHCDRCGDDHLDAENAVDFIIHYEPIDCYHNYEEDIFAYIDPTCSELGISVFVCTECENTIYATDYSSNLVAHENVAGEILTNGCDSKDVEDRACKWCCYDEDGNVIGSIDWAHSDLHLGVEYPATCIRDAYIIDFCGACGYNEVIEEFIGTALGISAETCEIVTTKVVEATVTSTGMVYRSCIHCGTDYSYETPAIPGVEYTATLNADKLTLGSQFSVTISVDAYNQAAWGFEFNVPYDTDLFVLTGYELAYQYAAAADKGGIVNVAGNFNGTVISDEQTIIVLYFEVIGNVCETYTFCVENAWTVDADKNTVDSYAVSDTCLIEMFMDLDRDGDITLLDALKMWEIATGAAGYDYDVVGDIDRDGEITLNDLIALYDYLVNN